MTISSVFSQLLQQVQFLGLLSGLSIQLPDVFKKWINWLNVANLDFQTLLGHHNLPAITFRRTFMAVSLGFPLLIALALILMFQPAYVVMWYSTILAGALLLGLGVIAYFLPTRETELTLSAFPPTSAMIIGGTLVFTALVVGFVFWVANKLFGENDSIVLNEAKRQSWLLLFHRSRTLRHGSLFAVLFVVGLILSGFIPIAVPGFKSSESLDNSAVKIVGYVLLGLAGVVLFYGICNLFRCTRVVMNKIVAFFGANMLLILTIAVSASYTPVIEYSTNIFLCTRYECSPGKVFNPFAQRTQGSFDVDESTFCDTCVFNETLQPQCTTGFATQYCPGYNSFNSWRYPNSTCRDETYIYFAIAAVAVLGIYAAAIPVLYVMVIRAVTVDVLGAVIVDLGPEERYDSIWIRKMAAVSPVVCSLYDPFSYPRRYFQVIQLLYRLFVTLIVNIMGPFTQYSLVVLAFTHTGMGLFLLICRPYLSFMERILSIALAICNTLDIAFAIVIWQKGRDFITPVISYAVIVINVIIPVILAVITGVMAFMRRRRNRAAAEAAENDYEEKEASRRAMEAEEEATRRQQSIEKGEAALEMVQRQPDRENPRPAQAARKSITVPVEAGALNMDTSYFGEHTELAMQFAERGLSKRVRTRYNEVMAVAVNRRAETLLSRTFMVVGVVLLVALGVAALGIMREPAIPFRQGSSTIYRTTASVLGGYDSWANFTENCCCINQSSPGEDWTLAERWVCRNGNIVEHGRGSSADSGLFVRDFCSPTFRVGCAVTIQTNLVSFSCTDGQEVVPANISAKAYAVLW